MNLNLDKLTERLPALDEALLHLGAALVVAVICLVIYCWIARMLRALLNKGRLSQHAHAILKRLAGWVLFVIAAVLVLQQFGMMENAWATLTAVLAIVGVGFVAVWSVLSNALCAIILMALRPFNVGDTIETTGDKLSGKVIDFNLIFTTLRDEQGGHCSCRTMSSFRSRSGGKSARIPSRSTNRPTARRRSSEAPWSRPAQVSLDNGSK